MQDYDLLRFYEFPFQRLLQKMILNSYDVPSIGSDGNYSSRMYNDVFLTLTHVFYELLASRDFTKLLAKSVVTEGHR